jgi:23S rRNA (uracil1939-C5)-methyltransferase
MKLVKNSIIELLVESYAFEGKGVAFIPLEQEEETSSGDRGFVVFVQGAYPGERVLAKLTKVKSRFAESVVTEILDKSPLRVPAECSHFGVCGGCKQQDLLYSEQLKHKQQQISEIFKSIGGIQIEDICESVLDIIGADKQFYYRNKMEFSFATKRWLTSDEAGQPDVTNVGLFLGLHVPGVYDKVLDLKECKLQSPISEEIVTFTREYFIEKGLDAYSTKTHIGYLKNLVIRQAQNTSDLMVNLVTAREEQALVYNYASTLREKFPQITTIINNITSSKALVAKGEYEIVLFGEGKIYDKIGDYKFGISANSFFQTNTSQAEKLYSTTLEFADLTSDDIVYDLYCGAGTIAIYISKFCKTVYGFEAVADSIIDAGINKELNNASHLHFYMADLYKSFLPIISENRLPKPTVIILDPPRSGLHPNTLSDVLAIRSAKIVYVSCNPASQARDIKGMMEAGYQLVKMRAVDMFPNTYHIENVALLTIKT